MLNVHPKKKKTKKITKTECRCEYDADITQTLYPMHAGQNNPIKLAAAATQLHYVTAPT